MSTSYAERNGNERWPKGGAGSPTAPAPRAEAFLRRAAASAGFLLDATRRRRSGRIALWSLVIALALTGVGMLSYPVMTDVWAGRRQSGLEQQFKALPVSQQAWREVPVGNALTRIVIPKLGVDVIVVEGTSGNALRAGAGHYPGTPLPGDPGNVAIAGHRTGFGQPFRHLERLTKGDRIELHTPFGLFTYRVMGPFDGHGNPWITGPSDFSVIGPTPVASLTLTTCDPPHTSRNRLIVRAELVKKA